MAASARFIVVLLILGVSDVQPKRQEEEIKPPLNGFAITDVNDFELQCIMAEFGAQLKVEYTNEESNEQETALVAVPNPVLVNGDCGTNTISLDLRWNSTSGALVGFNSLHLGFSKDQTEFFLRDLSFSLVQLDSNFPGIKNDPYSHVTGEASELREFATIQEHSFACLSGHVVNNETGGVDILFSDMVIYAFNQNTTNTYAPLRWCPKDVCQGRGARGVWIAVGTSLGLVMVGTLVVAGVLFRRYRAKQGRMARPAFGGKRF